MARYMRDGMKVAAREGGTLSGVLVQFWYLGAHSKFCSSGQPGAPTDELKGVADRSGVGRELMVVVNESNSRSLVEVVTQFVTQTKPCSRKTASHCCRGEVQHL